MGAKIEYFGLKRELEKLWQYHLRSEGIKFFTAPERFNLESLVFKILSLLKQNDGPFLTTLLSFDNTLFEF